MYDDLIKRLRSQCRGYGKECEDCNADGNCRSQMENEAADAIEELEKRLAGEMKAAITYKDAYIAEHDARIAEVKREFTEKEQEAHNDYDVDPYNAEQRCLAILQAAYAIELLQKTQQLSRWIPVEERLPKYGERVLVFGGVTMYVAYYDKNRYGGESWHKLNSKSHYCNPTHWMPLPEPPKEV